MREATLDFQKNTHSTIFFILDESAPSDAAKTTVPYFASLTNALAVTKAKMRSAGLAQCIMPLFYATFVVVSSLNADSPSKAPLDMLIADAFSSLLLQDWTKKAFAEVSKGAVYLFRGITLTNISEASKKYHVNYMSPYSACTRGQVQVQLFATPPLLQTSLPFASSLFVLSKRGCANFIVKILSVGEKTTRSIVNDETSLRSSPATVTDYTHLAATLSQDLSSPVRKSSTFLVLELSVQDIHSNVSTLLVWEPILTQALELQLTPSTLLLVLNATVVPQTTSFNVAAFQKGERNRFSPSFLTHDTGLMSSVSILQPDQVARYASAMTANLAAVGSIDPVLLKIAVESASPLNHPVSHYTSYEM